MPKYIGGKYVFITGQREREGERKRRGGEF